MKYYAMMLCLLLVTVQVTARQKFTFTPEKPKAGDAITVTYENAESDLVEAAVYQTGAKSNLRADDLVMTKNGNKWTGSVTTDTSMNFLFFGFKAGEKFDANNNDGYYILLYDGDKPATLAYNSLAQFYQYYGYRVGLESNQEKAVQAFEKELEFYPDNKKRILPSYVSVKSRLSEENSAKMIQSEIEAFLKTGLKEESDYDVLVSLYGIAKLNEQAKLVNDLKKEKFPDGKWQAADLRTRLQAEKDIEKKKELLAEFVAKTESGASGYEGYKENLNYFRSLIPRMYLSKREWENFKTAVESSGIDNKPDIASLYNTAAWEMQKDSSNLALAEQFASMATAYADEARKDPKAVKPVSYTQKQWIRSRDNAYAMYADTYAMVLYRAGKYKKGYDLAKAAAITVHNGQDADKNNTYALLASKVLPPRKLLPELEKFVKDGKHSAAMVDMLKDAYVKSKKSDKGFDDYLAALQRESYSKMLAELRKSMLNEEAPAFALYNLEGKKADIKDLRGKVVVVDFWATWCGPCIASFPGMQRAVDKYRDNPNVKFIFIDTWESSDDKKKNASSFIAKNNYSFDVWMDDEDKVVEQFKVDGIPTKFVLDTEGRIRFRAVGFDGSDEKLVQELTAMIDLASKPVENADKKGF